MSGHEVRCTRPLPGEWPDLYAEAQRRTISEGSPNWDVSTLMPLGLAIDPLERISIINNSYYAYGFAIRGFAKYLSDHEARQQVVKTGADLLLEASKNVHGNVSGLAASVFRLDQAFEPAIQAGYQSTPTPVKLLGNYLITVDGYRGIDEVDVRPAISSEIRWFVRDQMVGTQKPVLERGIVALMASPKSILYRILYERGIDTYDRDIPSPKAIKKLRHPSVKRLATQLCTVNSDQSFKQEVMEVKNDSVSFVAPLNGRPTFYSSRSKIRQQDNDYNQRRTLPMVCPALYVKGVVPLVMDLTIDMLDLASQKLAA